MSDDKDKKTETKKESRTGFIADKLVVDTAEVVETASISAEEVSEDISSTSQDSDLSSEAQEKQNGNGSGTRKATTGSSVRPELL